MKHDLRKCLVVLAAVLAFQFFLTGLLAAAEPEKIVQAQAILTVADSKRLIGKAVGRCPS